ncbi:MAG: lichenicidin A2 family type 2 lantibiotic [Lachnospiraceae bacterium]|nr:lichenicidin A2 family type 2 lantibiotic [Lachnospiraceae bacterium]
MKSREFIGEAFEELTIDEMKMVQGSGDVEAEGHIVTTSIISTGPVIPPVASTVLVTLIGKC